MGVTDESMARSYVSTLLVLFIVTAQPSFSDNQCDQVPGGPGYNRESHKASFACKCSGANGCDTYTPQPYPGKGYANLVTTDRAENRLAEQPQLQFQNAIKPTKNSSKVLLQTGRYYKQTMDGFGTGLSDSSAYVIQGMTSAAQQLVLDQNFGADGNDYDFVRTNIGTCTFSKRPYTYDDVEGDFDLENFALTEEDTELKLPIMQAIKDIKQNIQMMGAMWTPPNWLKQTGLENSGAAVLTPKYLKTLSNYLIKYLDAWNSNNFNFWGISPTNEPVAAEGDLSDYPDTAWNPYIAPIFMASILSPLLSKTYPNVQIISNDVGKVATPFYAGPFAD